jgi:hypothetical protein
LKKSGLFFVGFNWSAEKPPRHRDTIALRAGKRQKVKQCGLGGFHQRATAEPEGQKAKGKR